MAAGPDSLRIAIAQLNPIVGDIAGNRALAERVLSDPRARQADLVVFTELFISGYPPEDLVLRPAFIETCREAIEGLAATTGAGPAVLIGAPWRDDGLLRNTALLLAEGRIAAVRHKIELPNYGVFDEKRVFAPGDSVEPVSVNGFRIALGVCEDIWSEEICRRYADAGAELLVSIHGSPYWRGKQARRREVVAAAAARAGCPVIYANMVGGQDELVFDGASFGVGPAGQTAFQFKRFEETLESVSVVRGSDGELTFNGPVAAVPSGEEADWLACVIGLRDYVGKNGFRDVVLGLSGGIDSAVVATMAVDALGADKVRCVMLPYRYTSEASRDDAALLAERLGVRLEVVPIARPVEGAEAALAELFAERQPDVTEENIQARIRGVLLMAISNKFNELLLTTGNKSEVSVGYSTLYGDMNGGFNPIKDLYKTEVYRLAEWRNRGRSEGLMGPGGEVIPPSIITKAPTAELRADQTDLDSLPPYDELDAILEQLIEGDLSVSEITAGRHDAATVRRVARLVSLSEYKRRQAAPGVKVSARNFGRDRRYPITNGYTEE